jgi:nitroreductase
MDRKSISKKRLPGPVAGAGTPQGAVDQRVALPKPTPGRAASLHDALKRRSTNRSISERKLPLQTLSNLLSAAHGVNRREGPFGVAGRTAASASNSQEIELYVALEQGVYRYEPAPHCLTLVRAEDVRPLAIGKGQGSAGARAPVRLIYVVDVEKFSSAGFQEPGLQDPETQKAYYYVDTGLIAGNVYLFAASQGLAAWFHNCNKAELSPRLGLRPSQRALFGQTVGYPEKSHR